MVEALGLSLTEVIFAILNFLILFGVLMKFLWKPFCEMLDNRTKTIQDSFDRADAVNKEADERLEEYGKLIADAKAEGRDIVRQAKEKADEQARFIIDDANAKAASIIMEARERVEEERVAAVREMKTQIADLAILAAEKVIGQNLTADGQEKIIDDIIEQAGAGGWQN